MKYVFKKFVKHGAMYVETERSEFSSKVIPNDLLPMIGFKEYEPGKWSKRVSYNEVEHFDVMK